jgi:hypothetical protein
VSSKFKNFDQRVAQGRNPKRDDYMSKDATSQPEMMPMLLTVPLADRLALSPEQTSALTGIGISRIREAIRGGSLSAHRNGASIVVLPDDIRAWLKGLPEVETKKGRP